MNRWTLQRMTFLPVLLLSSLLFYIAYRMIFFPVSIDNAPSASALAPILNTGVSVPPTYNPSSTEAKYAYEVLLLTNLERQKKGLQPLAGDNPKLHAVARIRVQDIAVDYRNDHTRPNGDAFSVLFQALNVDCKIGGENIAAGYLTPTDVVDAWMQSETHRANIVNPEFTHLGIGVIFNDDGYGVYWTQEFTG